MIVLYGTVIDIVLLIHSYITWVKMTIIIKGKFRWKKVSLEESFVQIAEEPQKKILLHLISFSSMLQCHH